MSNFGDYIDPDFQPQTLRLDDQEYGRVLDAVVITCVDIALTCQGQVLMGKRTRHPQADWWIIGGRMQPGETVGQTASRICTIETRLGILPDRFTTLTAFTAAWPLRAQAPANHGVHTSSFVAAAELSMDEMKHVRLNDEYSDYRWVKTTELRQDRSLHPALWQIIDCLP